MTKPGHAARRIGLLATEMATRGGVQSFMLRISEVIGDVVEEDPSVQGYCLSLNDSTAALQQHPGIPGNLSHWGADGSKKPAFERLTRAAIPCLARLDAAVLLAAVALDQVRAGRGIDDLRVARLQAGLPQIVAEAIEQRLGRAQFLEPLMKPPHRGVAH